METSSDERKQLTINPEHFVFKSNRTTQKAPRTKPSSEIHVRASSMPTTSRGNTLKRNALLKFIRRHQANNYQRMMENGGILPTDGDDYPVEETPKSEIDETLEYLMGVAEEVKRSQPSQQPLSMRGGGGHSYTVRSPHIQGTGGVGVGSRIQPHEHVSMTFPETPLALPTEYHIPPSYVEPSTIALTPRPLVGSENPQYGCLKGGTLPTYRMLQSQQRAQPLPQHTPYTSPMVPVEHATPIIPRYEDLDPDDYEFHEGGDVRPAPHTIPTNPENIRLKVNRQRRTNRRTFRIGKSPNAPKVGVLVSNRTIRKSISTKALLLKQTPIHEIKKFLVARNLIRVGSSSPDYVLRHLYENAKLLCGDIYNHNNEVLLHNFIKA